MKEVGIRAARANLREVIADAQRQPVALTHKGEVVAYIIAPQIVQLAALLKGKK